MTGRLAGEGASVSVVVPTRDRLELVGRAVNAILQQRYEGHIGCIVVFDQSEPRRIPVNVPPNRSLRCVANGRTPGLAGARNTGALAATGELLAFCDDDDEWLPGKLQQQVEVLAAHPYAIGAVCGIEIRYGGRSFDRVPGEHLIERGHLLAGRRMEINPCTILVPRTILLDRVGLVDEEIPGAYGEDYEWLLRASKAGALVVVREPLVRINWHQGSWFATRWRTMIEAIRYMLRKHPELAERPRNLARMHGRVAFAHAALGERRMARRWARQALASNRWEPRAYLALAVSARLLSAPAVQRLARRFGRGV